MQQEINIQRPDSKGVWINTHFYREGCVFHLDVYTVIEGQPRVFKAAVDLVPIYRAVKGFHEELHAKALQQAVSGMREISDVYSPSDIMADFELEFGDDDDDDDDDDEGTVSDDELSAELDDEFLAAFDWDGMAADSEFIASGNHSARVGWNPFKKIARAVKKIGRVKLLKQVSRQFKAIGTSGAFKAITAASAVIPVVGPALAAGGTAISAAAHLAKAAGEKNKAGLLKAVAAVASSQLGTDVSSVADVAKAANTLSKALPPELKKQAPAIVKLAIRQGGGVKGITKALPPAVRKRWGQVLKKGVQADQAIKRYGGKSLESIMPPTATLIPRVSDDTLGAYAIANRAIAALRQSKLLDQAAKAGKLKEIQGLTVADAAKIRRDALAAKRVMQRVNATRATDPAAARAWRIFQIVNHGQQRAAMMGRQAVTSTVSGSGYTPKFACVGGQIVTIGCSCTRAA